MYRKTLATILIALISTWVLGGVLGSRKVKKAAVVGVVLLAPVAALIWLLVGIPPVPAGLVRTVKRMVRG